MKHTEGKTYRFDTLQTHAGQNADPATGSCAVPIYQTAAYLFHDTDHAVRLFSLEESGNIYTRIMNPTTDVLEKRLAALEDGVGAVAVASGMSAIAYALFNVAQTGDEILALSTLYGGTYTLLMDRMKRHGITVRLVGPEDLAGLEAAITDKTRAVYLETIGNPNMNIPDIEAIAGVAHRHGVCVVADNTFGTPYLVRLKEYGVDVVVHSLTKYIGGHGTSIGGAVIDLGVFDWHNPRYPDFIEPDPGYHGLVYADMGAAAYITKLRVMQLRDTGAALSPFNAFLFLQGLETLSLRMERHSVSALRIARWLQNRPEVQWVSYPGLPDDPYYARAQRYFPKGVGGILAFGIRGGVAAGKRFIDALEIFSLLANVSDTKSLVIHPASTTHSQLDEEGLRLAGVEPEAIRLSVGLEDIDDLIEDLRQALLKAIAGT
ncbi:MAG: aminotransferase class V-fold PLP-dependent enzyme [Clostridia bacterium]|nr:aminotransferase class V-fold PLP-dependent enzyme [Clostridia bacterium]